MRGFLEWARIEDIEFLAGFVGKNRKINWVEAYKAVYERHEHPSRKLQLEWEKDELGNGGDYDSR